jgi:hypothetical protein
MSDITCQLNFKKNKNSNYKLHFLCLVKIQFSPLNVIPFQFIFFCQIPLVDFVKLIFKIYILKSPKNIFFCRKKKMYFFFLGIVGRVPIWKKKFPGI